MNYAQLYDNIVNFTQNNETTFLDSIPTFVQNTETLVNNTVQLPAFRTNVTGVTTANFQYIALPPDFLAVFSLAVFTTTLVDEVLETTQTFLYQKDVEYVREMYPFPGVTGTPRYYGIFDNTALIVGPTPDDAYDVELHYYAYPQSIVTAGTSWLGDNFPNVLLWGSLVEAYIYMKGEPDLIQTYQQKYQESMQLLKQLGDGKDRIDTYRTTQVRDRVV